jgi:hypothetical protein
MNAVMLTEWQSAWWRDRLKTRKETIFNCSTFSCMSLYTALYGISRVCWMQQNEFNAACQNSQGQSEEKVKFTLEQATKAPSGSTALVYSFFNLSARLGWVVNTMLCPLYPLARDPVRTVQERGRAPGPVCTVAENLTTTTRIRSPDHPAHSMLLYQLHYPCPSIQSTRYKEWMCTLCALWDRMQLSKHHITNQIAAAPLPNKL